MFLRVEQDKDIHAQGKIRHVYVLYPCCNRGSSEGGMLPAMCFAVLLHALLTQKERLAG